NSMGRPLPNTFWSSLRGNCIVSRHDGFTRNNIRHLPLSGKWQSDLIQIGASDAWRRCRKRNYAVSIERLFDAVERRGDIGRWVAAFVLPISNRARVTSSCAGKIGLCDPGEHTSGPNLASRDNVAHNQNYIRFCELVPRPG